MPSQDKRKQSRPGRDSTKKLRRDERNNNNDDDTDDDSSLAPSPGPSVDLTTTTTNNLNSKCGVLKWISIKNFMCHDFLEFTFNPHINFVKGRNGSGKSAILTAVVVGLGGVARSTNRGNSLKELIKHGKQTAVIEVAINNCGYSAYNPELYGNTIIVERRICASAQGGYKLKNFQGKMVSNKKDELSRILEHFNLQVNNPVTILNQDMSRSFFNTTEPKTLFKLFLKATQLQQVKDDYAELQKNISSALRIIECRKECLPDLEKEVEEQRVLYQFSVSLREKGNKLRQLRHELAWAKITELEQKKTKAEEDLEQYAKSKEEIKEKIETLKKVLEDETEVRERNTRLMEEATSHLSSVTKQVREMDGKMRKVKDEYKEKQSQFVVTERKVRTLRSEIATLKSAIEKDDNGKKSQWAAERAEWQRKINIVESKVKEVMENTKTEMTHFDNLQHTMDVKKAEKTNLDVEEKSLRRQIAGFERELKGFQDQKGSPLTVYGQWAPQLLKKISQAHSNKMFIKKPVGPMGAFIKVRDTRWAHVAERVLGRRVTGFCVDNQKDEKVLRNLMKTLGIDQQSMPIVTVSRFRDEVLDVSKFETSSSKYSSLWSILDISNSVVANTVIDLMQAESILLIPTSQEAGMLLKHRSSVPKNCKYAYTLNLDQYFPDPNYRVYSGRGPTPARFLEVSVEDKVRDITKNKEECIERLNTLLEHDMKEVVAVLKNLQENIKSSNRKIQGYKKSLGNLRMTLAELQNQDTPPPPDVSQLEEEVKLLEENLGNTKDKMEEIRLSSVEKKQEFADLSSAILELRRREKDAYSEVERCKSILEEATANAARLEIQAFKKKDKELENNKKHFQEALAEAEEALKDAVKNAEMLKLGTRIETNRSVKELERQYNALRERLDKERAISGDPVTIAERYLATKQRYKAVSEDLSKQINLMSKLQESLHIREAKCLRLHKWLAVIVKYFFKEHLSVRKLDGSIFIDIEKETLNIHVEKPGVCHMSPVKNQVKVKGFNHKDVKKTKTHQDLTMMSGGERSFATVAFIIALWHAILSPVRILDEFDVFMDVIARNHAMKMMISAAKQDTQYIFLTPLSLDTSKLRNCQFFEMPDHTGSQDRQVQEESQDH